MQHVTVQVKLGEYTFQGRAVESLDIRQAVGEHVECTLVFDRDPRATQSETAKVEAAKLADAQLQVILSKSADTPDGGAGAGQTSASAGGLFSGAGLAGAAVSTAKAAVGAAVKTAITNRTGSGRITADAVLAETGNAVGPQVATGVGSLLGLGGGAGGGNGAAANGAAPTAAAPNPPASGGGPPALFANGGFAGAAQSTTTDVLKAAVSTGISNQHGSGRITTTAVMGALGAAASAQVGHVVDAIGGALHGSGAPSAPSGAAPLAGTPATGGGNGAGVGAPAANGAPAPGAAPSPAPAAAGTETLAFEGQVREVRVEYRPDGAARFIITALSKSYELGAHADQRYFPNQSVSALAGALHVAVAGAVPSGAPRDYMQRGESDWALIARIAAGEGLQLRPTWGRRPGETAPQAAEIAQGFASVAHTLTWGRDLLEFAVVTRPTNPGVTGAFTDPTAKHAHTFRGVRKAPQWLGGAKPLVESLERVSTKDAGGGDPGNVEVGGLGGTRARTLEEFRTRLERASEARLGGAIDATGASTEPGLRAGDRITVENGGSGGILPTAWSADAGAEERKGTYGLKSVRHHWQNGLYRNEFVATPWAGYHPTPSAVEQRLPHAAAIVGGADAAGSEHAAAGGGTASGLTLAVVVDNDDPKQRGRVRVRYAWMEATEQSHWLRVAGLGGGNGHGFGVLPIKGADVVVAPVANDPEHPVVLGSLWNGVDKAAHSPSRQHWATTSGSGVAMTEGRQAGQSVVEMHTPSGSAMIRLNASGPLITIHSEGDLAIEAPNGELRLIAKSMTTQIETDAYREVKGKSDDKVVGNATLVSDAQVGMQGATVVVASKGTLQAHAAGMQTITGQPVTINP